MSIEVQLIQLHGDNILPCEKCIIVYHVAQGNDVILKGKGSEGEKLSGCCDVADRIFRADMNIQMTSDRWSCERQPVGNHYPFYSFLAIFIYFLHGHLPLNRPKYVSSG